MSWLPELDEEGKDAMTVSTKIDVADEAVGSKPSSASSWILNDVGPSI